MIRIARYKFTFQALESIDLPPYPGSAIRGIFGHGLKRVVCVTRVNNCGDCSLRMHCVYSYLFETPAATNAGQNAPHPLVLDVHQLERSYAPGATFSVEATLVGEASRHLPYLVQGWVRAGKRGLGREHARFELEAVDQLSRAGGQWLQLYPDGDQSAVFGENQAFLPVQEGPAPGAVEINLVTPYRGKRGGKLVRPSDFNAQGFVISLQRRISALQALHDPTSPPIDMTVAIKAASELEMDKCDLVWSDWTRHSSRQSAHMKMGGVTGRFRLRGEGLSHAWPAIRLGEWVQAGKNTLFGLGRYEISTPENGSG